MPGDPRRARIAKVHIAKKELAMEESAYRDLLRRITAKDTSTACTIVELDEVLNEMKRLGFADRAHRRKPSHKAYVRMIYGIWKDLGPFLTEPSGRALQSFVERQTGVTAPEFLTPEQANSVIEALKAWLWRERENAAQKRRERAGA